MTEINTIVVGAGQAGLAVSHELKREGVEHVVLERDRIGQGWRNRWDSFCLVTPNWSVQLPGYPYDRNDPDGFMPRDEIVAYLERYAASFGAPVREGVQIKQLNGREGGGFIVGTDDDADYVARSLVLATGAFQRPHRPAGAESLPASLLQIDIDGYTSPSELPTGDVLIIGSGQTGCQLAEELHEAGRRVVLACGRAPWAPRRIGDQDLFWWLLESGFLDALSETLPLEARLLANIIATGRDGGHDLSLRILGALGITLTGRFLGAANGRAQFASDLADSIAWGDARHEQLMGIVPPVVEKYDLQTPDVASPDPFDAAALEEIDLASFGAVLFTGGFRPDYRSWLPWTDAFDNQGFPIQRDGASTIVDDLYFVGSHFLRTRKSALLVGVGEDAQTVARAVAN
jgi:putative flavoprotein involved in K+ transport